jgi:hypothetical protein
MALGTIVPYAARVSGLLLFLFIGACAATDPAVRDEKFIIWNHGGFSATEVQRVRAQLGVGTAALEKYIGPMPAGKFPVTVNLQSGRGVSHSAPAQGTIELYRVQEVEAPIIHELTHVLAGYNVANGHWTQEGFASYMQDQYGEDEAFPTYKVAHGLVKLLSRQNSLLPMLEVMKDRNRGKYFRLDTPWERWLAYTQSTSFCRYLIEAYGKERFLKIYNTPFVAGDFERLYGKKVEVLLEDWLRYVSELSVDAGKAGTILRDMKSSLR